MAAKKDKAGIEALRNEVQALSESFRHFRDAMLTDAALHQAEQQQAAAAADGNLPNVTDNQLAEAATLMAAVGHPQRLRMAMLLAQNPVSVNDLVEQLGLSTTGAAYHHLKVLMNQGLVAQPQRGTFALTTEAAPRIHQLLSGLFGAPSDEPTSEKSSKKKNKG